METTETGDEAETVAAGRALGAGARPGDVVALVGDLGAGKTHFAKGYAAGCGHTGEVTSPTFSLVHEYRGGRLPVYHFDFYRIETADELISLGWDDYLESGGACLVEWADKLPALLPETTRWLRFEIGPDGTRLLITDH